MYGILLLSSQEKTPFKRVKEDEITVHPRLQDNSFEAKVRIFPFWFIKIPSES